MKRHVTIGIIDSLMLDQLKLLHFASFIIGVNMQSQLA